MGCLIKLLFALTVVMIGYGALELSIWFRERAPVEMSVRDYLAADDPPKWVVLNDAWVDWSEAAEYDGDFYVPVRPVGSAADTKLVMEVRSPEHLARAQQWAKRAADARPPPGDGAVQAVSLAGLTGGEWMLGRRGRRAIRRSGAVGDNFIVLRQDAKPRLWLPLLSLIGGCLMIRGGFWVAWAVRRPTPPPGYLGPPLPPEQMIAQTRQNAGDPPRRIKRYGGLRLGRPLWLVQNPQDALNAIYLEEATLLATGRIVWGHIVQANTALFAPGDTDLPAAIIYSADPYYDAHPEELEDLAGSLFDIKGEDTDPDLARFASVLADELTREMRLPVPPRLTGGRQVIYTSIVVRRTDLPDGRLARGHFPLLILPEQTPAALIVPWEWWSMSLLTQWRADAQPAPPPFGPPGIPPPPLPMPPLNTNTPMPPPPLPGR